MRCLAEEILPFAGRRDGRPRDDFPVHGPQSLGEEYLPPHGRLHPDRAFLRGLDDAGADPPGLQNLTRPQSQTSHVVGEGLLLRLPDPWFGSDHRGLVTKEGHGAVGTSDVACHSLWIRVGAAACIRLVGGVRVSPNCLRTQNLLRGIKRVGASGEPTGLGLTLELICPKWPDRSQCWSQ